MATVIKYGTKAGEALICDMNKRYYKGKTLYECYGSVSAKKRNSWEEIVAECGRRHGEKLHITGAGSHFYSCIYAYPVVAENGVITDFVIRKHTKANVYEMTMPIDDYINIIGLE